MIQYSRTHFQSDNIQKGDQDQNDPGKFLLDLHEELIPCKLMVQSSLKLFELAGASIHNETSSLAIYPRSEDYFYIHTKMVTLL